MIRNIINLGDAAAYCDFGPEVNQEINKNVIKYFRNIKDRNIRGITNITPSYNKLIISFDLSVTKFTEVKKLIENLEIQEKDENKGIVGDSYKIKIPMKRKGKFKFALVKDEEGILVND